MSHGRCVGSRRQLARVCSLYHVSSRNQMQAWRKSLYLTGQASHLPPSSQSEHQGVEKKELRKNTGQVWILASPRDASVLTFVKWGSSDFHLTWQLQLWPKHEFCPHCPEISPKDFIYLPFVFFFLCLCGIPTRAPFWETNESESSTFNPSVVGQVTSMTLILRLSHCEGKVKENVWRAWDHNAFDNDALLSAS